MPDVLDAPPPTIAASLGLQLRPQPHGGSILPLSGERARLAGRRGAAARKALRQAAAQPQAPTPPPPAQDPPKPQTDPFVVDALAQARAHIRTVSAELAARLEPHEPCDHCGQTPHADPIDVERLCRALAALAGWESKLAGRPDPGSLRPELPRRRNYLASILGE